MIDDTVCEHVGTLFEYIDHHYDHGEDHYPLAHNPVTRSLREWGSAVSSGRVAISAL
ncbi:MAG: hypothetical protein ACYDBJ_22600 [Aggregatilineales bacterium]